MKKEKIYLLSIILLLILLLCFGGIVIYDKILNDKETKETKISSREKWELREYIQSILATDLLCNKKPIYSFNDINDANIKWLTEVAYISASKKESISFEEINEEAKLLFGDNFEGIDKTKVVSFGIPFQLEYYFVCGDYNKDKVNFESCYHPGHGGNGMFVNLIDNISKIGNQYIVTMYTHDNNFSYFEITGASLYYGIEEAAILETEDELCKTAIGQKIDSIKSLKCKGIYALNSSDKYDENSPLYYYGSQNDFENYVIGNDKDFDKMKLTIIKNNKDKFNIISSFKVN